MKKNMKTICWLLFLALGMGAAYLTGMLRTQWQEEAWQTARNSRQKEFNLRVERYEPTCGQLWQEGLSPVVSVGDDRILVQTTTDYFYVIGINLAPGKSPLTTWWGAGRANALQNCPKQ